jgi:zinc D-Ala-D-Ala carboxypeptidase
MAFQNKVNHIKVAEFFHLDEFQCPCCLQVILDPLLLQKLDSLRNKIKNPIIVTSGYRCTTHNKDVGGVKGSYHLFGMAADVYAPKISLKELLKSAEEIGFSGIGYYPKSNFLHLDIRPAGPARWQG